LSCLMNSLPHMSSCSLLTPLFGPSPPALGGPRGGSAPGRMRSSGGKPSSEGSGMGGSSPRRSSKVVLSESRRFCSAALCEVLRICTTGWGSGPVGGVETEDGLRGLVTAVKFEMSAPRPWKGRGVVSPGRMALRFGLVAETVPLLGSLGRALSGAVLGLVCLCSAFGVEGSFA
jgi:hypothetical protein